MNLSGGKLGAHRDWTTRWFTRLSEVAQEASPSWGGRRHGSRTLVRSRSCAPARVCPRSRSWRPCRITVPLAVCAGTPILLSGRLGNMANLSWVKSLTLDAAARELEWDIARRSAQYPHFPAENEGFFWRHRRPSRQPMRPLPPYRPTNAHQQLKRVTARHWRYCPGIAGLSH